MNARFQALGRVERRPGHINARPMAFRGSGTVKNGPAGYRGDPARSANPDPAMTANFQVIVEPEDDVEQLLQQGIDPLDVDDDG